MKRPKKTGNQLVDAKQEQKYEAEVIRKRDAIFGVKWARIVLDEGQYAKNESAQQTQACRLFDGAIHGIMSGTIMTDTLEELFSHVSFLQLEGLITSLTTEFISTISSSCLSIRPPARTP